MTLRSAESADVVALAVRRPASYRHIGRHARRSRDHRGAYAFMHPRPLRPP
jgi:hypothetical protein